MKFKPYKPSNPERFLNFAKREMPELGTSFDDILIKMGALVPDWWGQAIAIIRKMPSEQIGEFLASIADLLEELSNMGLGMNPSWAVLNERYKAATTSGAFSGRRVNYCINAYRLIEEVGLHLLIQRRDKACITDHTLKLIEQHRCNASGAIILGENLDGTRFSLEILEQRYLERRLRLEGLREFCMHDLNWHCINFTMTAPAHFESPRVY